jgi:hypothetical protein
MNKPLVYFFFAVIAVIGSAWIVQSNGFYYIDELSRFLYSRFVLQALPVTVETWHRPIPLWLFALPAQLGHRFTMFFGLGLYLVVLLFTYKIAVLKGLRHAEWVVLLTGLQPILFDISYSCMNEIPAALVIVLSYWSHLKGRHGWSLAIASLAIMCRPEAYVFAGLMFLAYLYHREWKLLPLVVIGPVIWIALTASISGSLLTFFTEWSAYSHVKKYLPGVSVFFYPQHLADIFGIAQVLFFAIGVVAVARAKKTADYAIMYATIASSIILNTLTGAEVFHWTGSIADLRYLTVVGPFFGIIAVSGMSDLLERIPRPASRTAFSVVVLGILVFNCTLTTHPRRWENYDKVVIDMTAAAVKTYPGVTILSNHPIVHYMMDVAPTGGVNCSLFTQRSLSEHATCLVLVDPFTENSIYFSSDVAKEDLLRDPAMVVVDQYVYAHSEYLLLYKNSRGGLAELKHN